MCEEELVLYKIISGLHTSISSDISRLYKNVTEPAVWADSAEDKFVFNHKFYNERVVNHPDRVKNMLFLYELLVRSIERLSTRFEVHRISSDDVI